MEPYDASLPISIFLYSICWGFGFINKIGIKDIELVALYNLRWGIVMIVVSLVVFVPLISCVNPIEVFGFPWTVFVMPPVDL